MRRITKWAGLACVLLFVGGWAQEARNRAYQERDSGERRMKTEEGDARGRYDSRERRGYHARKAQTAREVRGPTEGKRRYDDRRGRGGYHSGMWGIDRGMMPPQRPPREESDFCVYGEAFYGSARLDGGFPESQSWKEESGKDTVITRHPMDWDWSFGGRGGVGWKLRERWGMDISYLWFRNQASSLRTQSAGNDTLYDFVSPPLRHRLGGAEMNVPGTLLSSGVALPATQAERKFSICYQELAWDLKGFVGNSDPFLASFSLGLLGVWQKQTYDQESNIQFSDSAGPTWTNLFMEKKEWDVRGIGARVGAGAFWSLGRIVYLFGEGSVGVSCLHSDMDQRDNSAARLVLGVGSSTSPFEAVQPLVNSERRYRLCPFFGVKAGVQLVLISKDFQKNFFVQVGWETHFWPKQLFHLNLDGSLKFHDLLMYGATGRISIGF